MYEKEGLIVHSQHHESPTCQPGWQKEKARFEAGVFMYVASVSRILCLAFGDEAEEASDSYLSGPMIAHRLERHSSRLSPGARPCTRIRILPFHHAFAIARYAPVDPQCAFALRGPGEPCGTSRHCSHLFCPNRSVRMFSDKDGCYPLPFSQTRRQSKRLLIRPGECSDFPQKPL